MPLSGLVFVSLCNPTNTWCKNWYVNGNRIRQVCALRAYYKPLQRAHHGLNDLQIWSEKNLNCMKQVLCGQDSVGMDSDAIFPKSKQIRDDGAQKVLYLVRILVFWTRENTCKEEIGISVSVLRWDIAVGHCRLRTSVMGRCYCRYMKTWCIR